jgi:phage-related protein
MNDPNQNEPKVKPVIWVGDSLKQIKAFPVEVRQDINLIKNRYKQAIELEQEAKS